MLESSILEQQKGQPHYDLLYKSLQSLISPSMISKGVQRAEKMTFIGKMNKFLLDVKGFLCIM